MRGWVEARKGTQKIACRAMLGHVVEFSEAEDGKRVCLQLSNNTRRVWSGTLDQFYAQTLIACDDRPVAAPVKS